MQTNTSQFNPPLATWEINEADHWDKELEDQDFNDIQALAITEEYEAEDLDTDYLEPVEIPTTITDPDIRKAIENIERRKAALRLKYGKY